MACTQYTISGIAKGCRDSLGGIVKVWVSTNINIPSVNASLGTSGEITHIDSSVASSFKPFEFFKNTGSMTTNANVSDTAGTSFTTEVNLQFMKMETAKRIEVMGLMFEETCVIVKDSNKKYWMLGWDEPVQGSAGTGASGTTATDLNGYTVVLKDDSRELPREVLDTEFISDLEAIVIA